MTQISVNPTQLQATGTGVSRLTDDDLYLFNEGSHFHLYEKLGSHPLTASGTEGTYFAVWAPTAGEVCVKGDFNGWQNSGFTLSLRGNSGIWEGFIPGMTKGSLYKYRIINRYTGYAADKADPFARYHEVPPLTASIVWDTEYPWQDGEWVAKRDRYNSLDAPVSVYEVHLGSWMRVPEEENRSLNYREIAQKLAEYVKQMGFTHVEFMPVTEHPSTGRGATKQPAISPQPAATARPRISCIW